MISRFLPYPVPAFLDFEASSLASSSYPIEVAWTQDDGMVNSYLISPAGIEQWTVWSAKAEALHGISRESLLAQGRSPSWVCRRMNEALTGKTVYVEDPSFDGMWLAELFRVSRQQPQFVLANIDELLLPLVCFHGDSLGQGHAKIREMKHAVREQCHRRHRADADVEYLMTLWKLAIEGSL